MKVTTFELDEWPLSARVVGAPDYASRQVMAAGFTPLFHVTNEDEVIGSELIRECVFGREREILIRLDERCRWSDGRAISTDDILTTLRAAAKSNGWNNHLLGIHTIEQHGHFKLKATLKWSVDHFTRLLSAVELSPSRPSCDPANGPYSGRFILSPNGTGITGKPNRFSTRCVDNHAVAFVVNRDSQNSIGLYESGALDITSNTGMSLDVLKVMSRHVDYRRMPTGIYMHIELGDKCNASLRNAGLRRFLSAAISRERLEARLGCNFSTTSAFEHTTAPEADALPTLKTKLPKLTLSYHAYPPNHTVAQFIEQCWKRYGVETELVQVDFAGPDGTSDLHLRLRFSPYPHWYAAASHYLSQLCRLHPELSATLSTRCLESLLEKRSTYPSALTDALYAFMPVIPILTVDGHWLQRETIGGYTVPNNACFDFAELQQYE